MLPFFISTLEQSASVRSARFGAGMTELVDVADLKSAATKLRTGSIPVSGTTLSKAPWRIRGAFVLPRRDCRQLQTYARNLPELKHTSNPTSQDEWDLYNRPRIHDRAP